MTCGLAGATRWATAFCAAGAKPIFDSAVDAAGVAAVAGPTAAGAAASTPEAAATSPEFGYRVSALAGLAKVATRPPVAATTAPAFMAG